MTETTDPWVGGAWKNTAAAQRAFDRRKPLTEDQLDSGNEYHRDCATTEDKERIDALEGDEREITAWYWLPSVENEEEYDRENDRQ